MPGVQTTDELFAEIQTNFRSDKAGSMNATFNFNITGENGGHWNAAIVEGNCTVAKGLDDKANVTIIIADSDWASVVNGGLNPEVAYMQGKLQVEGDLGLATKLRSLFL